MAAAPVLTLAGYRVNELVVDGPRSVVYRAVHEASGRPVLIEVHRDEYPSAADLAAMRHAYELSTRLALPCVVRHLALERYRNRLALVTEDSDAVPLASLIGPHGMPIGDFLEVAIGIAGALGQLHEHHVTHNDLKPQSVVVSRASGEVKLVDLGIAAEAEPAARGDRRRGGARCSFRYASPERTGRIHGPVDHRSDLYSFGIVCYEMLLGCCPFDSDDFMELLHCHVARRPEPPHEVDATVPEIVSRIVLKLLAKTADARYQSAYGVQRDLAECLAQLREKGFIESFPLALRDVSSSFHVPERLFGRAAEQAALEAALEDVARGAARVAMVTGASGIGKTALVHAMELPVAARRGHFCAGKFDAVRRDLPYVALAEALRALVRAVLVESASRTEALRESLHEALGESGRVMIDLVPELESLLGPEPELPPIGPVEAQLRFRRALSAFVRVFAREEHPLVLFLDDLQWADAASMEALRILVTDRECAHLLVIGGYRENELAPDHPLRALLTELEAEGRPALSVELGPLGLETLTQLVVETVRTTRDRAEELAAVVEEKTHGNPFFVRQLLRALHHDQLLRFDPRSDGWVWDVEAIRAVASTDNVVDLMTSRLGLLPARTREALEIAACIGAEFDLRTLAIVRGATSPETANALTPALAHGLIVNVEGSHGYLEALGTSDEHEGRDEAIEASYRFLHDRVQQAAHDLMPEETRNERHLRIGRLLLAAEGSRLDPERLASIVNHLNVGSARIEDPDERMRLAELNLAVGRRAKAATALDAAARHFELGIELLSEGEDAFRARRDLALALHVEAAEVAFARDDVGSMTRHTELVHVYARTTLERLPIYRLQIRFRITRNEHATATDIALAVLSELGVELPREPKPHHVVRALVAARVALGARRPMALLALPPLHDENVRAAMDILVTSSTCAYFAEPKLVPLIGLALVRLSMDHGNCSFSAYGYAMVALVLSGGLNRIEEGYAFGELAQAVFERYPARELVKVRFVLDTFVRHYKDPFANLAASLLDTRRRSLDVGDVETAVYCAGGALYAAIFAGANIDSIFERQGRAIDHVRASNQEQSKPGILSFVQLLEVLRDVTRRDGRLTGETFDLDAWIPRLEAARHDSALAHASTAAGILALVHGDLRGARARFARASASESAVVSQVVVPQLHFYRAIVDLRLAASSDVGAAERARLLVSGRMDTMRLRRWARHAPETFGSKVALLEALELSARDRRGEAIERFHDAIEDAQTAGFVHEAAIAAEALAEHCQRAGLADLSVHYVRKAHLLYSRWGAQGKVRSLELAYWDVFREPWESLGESLVAADAGERLDEQLDVASVVKAVSTLTMEMDLDRLLSRVMRVVIENAGAERAVLLTMDEGTLRVAAEGGLEGTMVHVDGPAAEDERSGVSSAITAYAARLRRSVVLADASADPLFGRDPWVVRRDARSVLCAPLLRSGTLTGVVFLENSLVSGAFTERRVRILEILCGQAAVSIENARLYKSLGGALEAQVRLTTAHSRFVPHPFLQALDRENIVDVELGDHALKEMSVLFSDIRGFASHMERLTPSQGIAFLNTYLSRMEAPILAHGGFVDSYVGDAIMALFEKSADHAVHAGVGMLAALTTLNRERERVGEPPIRVGIGINTGMLMLGTIGGGNHLKCGVIGDSVNVASRVETLTKRYGVSMLVSGMTFNRLEDPSRYLHRRIERVRVLGREAPVTLYEIFDADPPELRDAKAETAARFAEALALFYERDFHGAVRLFEDCARRAPADSVNARHLERARRLAAEGVHAAWDGVERLESK